MRVRLYISCFIVEVGKKFQITIANCVFCFTPNTGQETSNLFLSSLVQNFRQSEIVEPGIDLILMSLEWIISVHQSGALDIIRFVWARINGLFAKHFNFVMSIINFDTYICYCSIRHAQMHRNSCIEVYEALIKWMMHPSNCILRQWTVMDKHVSQKTDLLCFHESGLPIDTFIPRMYSLVRYRLEHFI